MKFYSSSRIFSCIDKTTDGGYIVKGVTIMKTDGSGNRVWEKSPAFSAFGLQCITETADGGFFAAGTSEESNSAEHDIILVKLDGDGNAWKD